MNVTLIVRVLTTLSPLYTYTDTTDGRGSSSKPCIIDEPYYMAYDTSHSPHPRPFTASPLSLSSTAAPVTEPYYTAYGTSELAQSSLSSSNHSHAGSNIPQASAQNSHSKNIANTPNAVDHEVKRLKKKLALLQKKVTAQQRMITALQRQRPWHFGRLGPNRVATYAAIAQLCWKKK